MRTHSFFRNIVWLFAGVTVLFFASPVSAINLLVYNNNDSGAGSLRQAIADNTTLGGGNTIVFSNVVTGTILLTSGQLFIGTNVNILGPGPNVLAINGNAAGRIFETELGNTNLIAGLTLTNASFPGGSGGAIFNLRSTLTVSNCTISGNSARNGGGIYNSGTGASATLVVKASTLSNNLAVYGGAINNNAIGGNAGLTLAGCILSSNSAAYGGGIYNDARGSGTAPVAISASTFKSNFVDYDGIYGGGLGGGIYNNGSGGGNATITLNTSTLQANQALDGGGIYNYGYEGTARLHASASTFSGNKGYGAAISSVASANYTADTFVNACTFSGNDGGEFGGTIYVENGLVQIGDSILKAGASNTNLLGYGGYSIVSAGYNLASDDGSGFLTATGDQLNTDPLLGPLANNGGPTLTHALLAGSPAIDKGKRDAISFLATTVDARGVTRPLDFPSISNAVGGDGSDIGAFEFNNPTLNIQKAGGNVVLSWPSFLGFFTLESSTNITSSNSWTTAGGSADIVGNQYQQTNGPISSNRCFRLRGN